MLSVTRVQSDLTKGLATWLPVFFVSHSLLYQLQYTGW